MRNVIVIALALSSATTHARFEPVLRRLVPELEARKTKLYVMRPCDVYPADPGKRREARRRLLPGDRVQVTGGFRRPMTTSLVAIADDRIPYRVKISCLSRAAPDYSYRARRTFKSFYHGLVRDLPRLMERYLTLMQKHNCHVPVTDPATRKMSDDWDRTHALLDHVKWVRGQVFYMAYSGRSERTVLRKEADWITKQSEELIRGFSGDSPKEVKQELKKIYLLLNRLMSLPGICGRLRRLDEQAAGAKLDGEKQYKDLDPAHRVRLQSEESAKYHSQQAELRTRLHTVVVEVRSGLMALGIKVR